MFNQSVAISQEYNYGLTQQYEELTNNYNDLKIDIERLYQEGIHIEEYSNKLIYHVDNTVIDNVNNQEYIESEISKKNMIKSRLKNYTSFDYDKLEKILKVRNNILKKRIEALDLDNIGTALNVIRDLYHDVYIDFERNKINNPTANKGIIELKEFSIDLKLNEYEDSEPFNIYINLKGHDDA